MKKIFLSLIFITANLPAQELKQIEVPDGTPTQVFKSIYNPETGKGTVGFAIKNDAKCTLRIYNSKRKKVAEILVDRELTKGGWIYEYEANFLAEGTYYYTLIADNEEFQSIRWKVWDR